MRSVGGLTSVAIVALLLGCDSNGSSSDLSPAAKAKWNEYCAQREAYRLECSADAEPCPSSTCFAQIAEQDALIEFFDCQLAKTCSTFFGDDDCVEGAGTSDAERDAFITRCTTTTTTCGIQSGYCIVGLPLIRKQWMRAFDACLTAPCEQMEACFEGAGLPTCW